MLTEDAILGTTVSMWSLAVNFGGWTAVPTLLRGPRSLRFFFGYLKFPRRTAEVFDRHCVRVALVVCHFFLLRPEGAHKALNLEN